MKKLALIAVLGLSSSLAMAAPVGETFTGWGAGVDLTSTKLKHGKRATGFGLVGDYGFDYGNNLVGLVEGKLKFNDSKFVDVKTNYARATLKEGFRISAGYLQGYRVLPDLLPYVKLSYSISKFKSEYEYRAGGYSASHSSSSTASSLGYGLGVKYAVSSNFELGAEYLRNTGKFEGHSLKANTFGANATYRF